ncbi:unnamed protein product, partial [marine sediment metagenome]
FSFVLVGHRFSPKKEVAEGNLGEALQTRCQLKYDNFFRTKKLGTIIQPIPL